MKKIITAFLCVFLVLYCMAQTNEPVTFSYSVKKIKETVYDVSITATLETGWHIYSQTTPPGGPSPTLVHFNHNPLIIITGKPKEVGELDQHYEKLFKVMVKQFSNQVNFVQRITLRNPIKTNLSGSIEYILCNDHECLPPSLKAFSIAVK